MPDPGDRARENARVHFLVPGDPDTPTGGYRYDREMASGLRALGWQVEWHRLADGFPAPGVSARADAANQLAALPDGALAVVDGLAAGVLAGELQAHAERLRLVLLVHHPLADESGLDAATVAALEATERAALACADEVIVTSAHTARSLCGMRFALQPRAVHVVLPGTHSAPLAVPLAPPPFRLLCVASLTPRKAHSVLLDAMALLDQHALQLRCAGATDLDPGHAQRLLASPAAQTLADRVHWLGVLDDAALAAEYQAAHVLVLPSLHEGYGMVLAEALARGVPVIASRAGAMVDTVPADAGLLVSPGSALELAGALEAFVNQPALRARLRRGAARARAQLPGWDTQAAAFAAVLCIAHGRAHEQRGCERHAVSGKS